MITVICPVYNEENYISGVLDFFVGAPPWEKELILIDGGSTDKTVNIIQQYQAKYPQIKLLSNPDKYVPFALNKAIASSEGDPVIRLDAHTQYSNDYFETILRTFEETGADIVGGPMRAIGNSAFQKAVAYATSTSMGVGDSGFHDEHRKGFTESVYLGAWRRYIFEKTGLFDTDMLRNQDDEFHYRARSHGFRIYLDPSIKSTYFPRNSLLSLYSQYYQYGLFKPFVLKKVSSGLRLRHLVPSSFFLYLLSLPVSIFYWWWLIPLFTYLALVTAFALKGRLTVNSRLILYCVYPALHVSYGSGFLIGLFHLIRGGKPHL